MTFCIFNLSTFFFRVVATFFDEVARCEMAGKLAITKKGPETAQSARELAPCYSALQMKLPTKFIHNADRFDGT